MIFYENRLLADDSHEISCLIFFPILGNTLKNLSSAAVVIGPLRVNNSSCMREGSGSVVECLTRDQGAAGSSLTGVTALWSLSKAHLF